MPDIGTANWEGVLNYLTYVLSPRLSATARDWNSSTTVKDRATGFEGLYTALTAGLTFKPIKDVWLRPEIRYDYNDESRPFENKHGLFTGTMDVIFRW